MNTRFGIGNFSIAEFDDPVTETGVQREPETAICVERGPAISRATNRRALEIGALAILLAGAWGLAIADDPKIESNTPVQAESRAETSKKSEKLVREAGVCYIETTFEKMVEECAEGRTYSTPITEKRRVKVACPGK